MDVNEENKYLKNLNNLLKGLKSPDSFTVANAIRQIGEMGNKIPVNVQKDVIKQILELTAGKDHTIRLYATMALGSLKNSTPIDMQAHVAQRLLELSGEEGGEPKLIAEWEAERKSKETSSNDELYLRGIESLCSENWTGALECFESIVRESPMHVLAYPMIGYCNLRLERWEGATEAYYQALLIDPQDAASYYDMALAYGKLNRWGEAKASYKQAIRLDSTNTDAYCGLGMAYVNLDDWEDARKSFEKAIELNPNSPRSHYGLGLTCMALDDMNAAWHEYHTLEALDRTMAEDLYSRLSE